MTLRSASLGWLVVGLMSSACLDTSYPTPEGAGAPKGSASDAGCVGASCQSVEEGTDGAMPSPSPSPSPPGSPDPDFDSCANITACTSGDGCCASACTPATDSDCTGAAWFVEAGATGASNGTSWSDAWPSTNAIAWTSVQPGDRIYISGGTAGKSYSAFTATKSGTAQKRISILRAVDPGHDGIVTLAAPVQIQGSFITLDGIGWNKMVLNAYSAAGGGGGGALWITGDNFAVKHVKFNGNYAAGGAYHTVAGSTALKTLLIQYCDFYKTAGEDHINWQGSESITVDHCVFTTPNPPNDGSHRDLMNPWTGAAGYDMYFTHNIVYGLASNGFAILFQESNAVGDIHIAYNVFANSPYAVRFGSGNGGADSIEMHNNVFYKTTDESGAPYAHHINDIFAGPSLIGGSVHAGSGNTEHCLWWSTTGFDAGNGNVNADPLFVDVTSPLGADGVPFTADDGFRLAAGSPAIDAGLAIAGETVDIAGTAIVAAPDIGAYER